MLRCRAGIAVRAARKPLSIAATTCTAGCPASSTLRSRASMLDRCAISICSTRGFCAARLTHEFETPVLFDATSPVMDAGQSLVTFGKCKGMTYEECRSREPEYCTWLLKNPHRLSDAGRGLAAYLQTRTSELPSEDYISEERRATELSCKDEVTADANSMFLTFGRYKGRSFQDIKESDPEYCSWVVRRVVQSSEDAPDGLRAFAAFLRGDSMQPRSEAAPRDLCRGFNKDTSGWSEDATMQNFRSMPMAQVSKRGFSNDNVTGAGGACVASGDVRILFGKYKGSTFAQVCAMDPQYGDWVVKEKMYEPDKGNANLNMWMFVAYIQHRRLQGI